MPSDYGREMLRGISLRAVVAGLACAGLALGVFAPAALATPTWLAPVDLSAAGQNAFAPQVASDAQGNAVAVWERSDGTNTIIQAAARPAASGAWQSPVDLSAAGQNSFAPQVAFDPQGNAVAVWERFNGSNYIVQAAGYDAAGPQLRALSIPGSGVARQTLSFSVSPLDVWSSLGPTSWSFGDGTGASGTAVTHAYSAAGSYRVTLTSADVLGNVSSTSGNNCGAVRNRPTTMWCQGGDSTSGLWEGMFLRPHGLTIDPVSGALYIADEGNGRVQRLLSP